MRAAFVWAHAFVRRETRWRDATEHGAPWGVGGASAAEGAAPAGAGLRGVSSPSHPKVGEKRRRRASSGLMRGDKILTEPRIPGQLVPVASHVIGG